MSLEPEAPPNPPVSLSLAIQVLWALQRRGVAHDTLAIMTSDHAASDKASHASVSTLCTPPTTIPPPSDTTILAHAP